MAKLEEAAEKWIKPYPNAEWRENIEVFLVAIVVAMAIRTFFLQPFKIPTGSMEPTLYGIEAQDLRDQPGFTMPGPLERFWDTIYRGTIYHEIIAPEDGQVVRVEPVAACSCASSTGKPSGCNTSGQDGEGSTHRFGAGRTGGRTGLDG